MTIRRLTGDDHALYRSIRLASLQTNPEAFGSTYEREAAFDEATWRARLSGSDPGPKAVFVDELEGEAIGTAAAIDVETDPAPMLIGMWVQPSARGTGAGKRLVAAAIAWVVDRQAEAMLLHVVHDNEPAIALYESCGFVHSGKVPAGPAGPCADELEMRLELGPTR